MGHEPLGLFDDEGGWIPSRVAVYLGKPFVYPQGSIIGDMIAHGGEWDSIFRITVPALLADDEPTICDVGGNIGASLLQILAARPRAHVLAFEPSGYFRPFLQCNLKLAGDFHIDVFPLLVGAQAGQGNIYGDHSSGSPRDLGHYTRRQLADMTTLDTAFRERRVDFIKIDTDGFEFEVLRGGEATLRRDGPVLHFEFSPSLVRSDANAEMTWLQDLGYLRLVILHPEGRLLGVTTDPGQAISWANEYTYCDILTCAMGRPSETRLDDLLSTHLAPRKSDIYPAAPNDWSRRTIERLAALEALSRETAETLAAVEALSREISTASTSVVAPRA